MTDPRSNTLIDQLHSSASKVNNELELTEIRLSAHPTAVLSDRGDLFAQLRRQAMRLYQDAMKDLKRNSNQQGG